jgi:hypothetical protein
MAQKTTGGRQRFFGINHKLIDYRSLLVFRRTHASARHPDVFRINYWQQSKTASKIISKYCMAPAVCLRLQ